MTQWRVFSQPNVLSLPMWRACRIVDGALKIDNHITGTQEAAQKRADELNVLEQKKERPKRRQPLRAQSEMILP